MTILKNLVRRQVTGEIAEAVSASEARMLTAIAESRTSMHAAIAEAVGVSEALMLTAIADSKASILAAVRSEG